MMLRAQTFSWVVIRGYDNCMSQEVNRRSGFGTHSKKQRTQDDCVWEWYIL